MVEPMWATAIIVRTEVRAKFGTQQTATLAAARDTEGFGAATTAIFLPQSGRSARKKRAGRRLGCAGGAQTPRSAPPARQALSGPGRRYRRHKDRETRQAYAREERHREEGPPRRREAALTSSPGIDACAGVCAPDGAHPGHQRVVYSKTHLEGRSLRRVRSSQFCLGGLEIRIQHRGGGMCHPNATKEVEKQTLAAAERGFLGLQRRRKHQL